MQTFGYWCDECRAKYAQAACKDALPCGHNEAEAVYVEAKAYARGGECVQLVECRKTQTLWLVDSRQQGVAYTGNAREMWGTSVSVDDRVTMAVGLWLHGQSPKVARAFLARWDTNHVPPLWRQIQKLTREEVLTSAAPVAKRMVKGGQGQH